MIITANITPDELRRAIKEIEIAEANGFLHCEAVYEVVVKDKKFFTKFDGLIVKAHPTKGKVNWGWTSMYKTHTFKEGKLLPIPQPPQVLTNL